MPEQDEIYQGQAQGYENLIAHEDFQGNLLPALQSIASLEGKIIVDMGTGTGRFIRMFSRMAGHIYGFDISIAMLQVAHQHLEQHPKKRWDLIIADNRQLPARSGFTDIVIAGWSFGHATVWYEDHWEGEIGAALHEMIRILRPGGTAIICETMGTGVLDPAPPTPTLAAYYRYLETVWGFKSTTIPTDYRFASLDHAVETIRFFFGDEMAETVQCNEWIEVPEWTGIWWRTAG